MSFNHLQSRNSDTSNHQSTHQKTRQLQYLIVSEAIKTQYEPSHVSYAQMWHRINAGNRQREKIN